MALAIDTRMLDSHLFFEKTCFLVTNESYLTLRGNCSSALRNFRTDTICRTWDFIEWERILVLYDVRHVPNIVLDKTWNIFSSGSGGDRRSPYIIHENIWSGFAADKIVLSLRGTRLTVVGELQPYIRTRGDRVRGYVRSIIRRYPASVQPPTIDLTIALSR